MKARPGDESGPTVEGEAEGMAGADDVAVMSSLSHSGACLAKELSELAVQGADGALHVVGRYGGLVHLSGGKIAHIEAWTTPGVELMMLRGALGRRTWQDMLAGMRTSAGRDLAIEQARELLRRGAVSPLEAYVSQRRAVADAAAELLGMRTDNVPETRLLRDEQPWLGLNPPLTVSAVVAGAAWWRTRLERVAGRIRPDTVVARCGTLPTATVRLNPTQWDLVVLAEGRTVREMAWAAGHSVFGTTLEVARLDRLGLLEPVRPRPAVKPSHRADRPGSRAVLVTDE